MFRCSEVISVKDTGRDLLKTQFPVLCAAYRLALHSGGSGCFVNGTRLQRDGLPEPRKTPGSDIQV